MNAIRLFISHSHQDNTLGLRLANDLRRVLGSEDAVWYDASGGLHGGDVWWRKIVDEITARPVFLVVLSADALASPWVRDEINLAWRQKNTDGKRIIPLLYRQCDIWQDLQTLQIISFLPERGYDAPFADLLTALGAPAQARPAPSQSQQSQQSQGTAPNHPGAIPGVLSGAMLTVRALANPHMLEPVLRRLNRPYDLTALQAACATALNVPTKPLDSAGWKSQHHVDHQFAASYADVVVAHLLALRQEHLELQALGDTPRGCSVQAHLSASIWTWAGTLGFEFQQVAPNLIRAVGTSEVKGQLFDWGKGEAKLRAVFAAAEALLARAAP